MMTNERIEIPFNNRRFVIILVACIICFFIGLYLTLFSPDLDLYLFKLVLINKSVLGVILMVFFGFFIYKISKRLSIKKPGLTITREGIIDHSSGIDTGLISRKDIQEIRISENGLLKFILIVVNNPDNYIDRASGLKKKLLQSNHQTYGTPIIISVNGLKSSFDELYQTLRQYYYK